MPRPPTVAEPAKAVARAKLNLCLHVTGRRPDGYHLLDSLVVFPDIGDRVTASPAARTSLALAGPFAAELDCGTDNLVLAAARLMADCPATLRLEKNLPVAAGLGGGSADAAATLRALAAACAVPLPDMRAVLALGADVPVCLDGRATRMQGIGERLSPLPPLPPFWTVLANPLTACPTPRVFAELASKTNPGLPDPPPDFPDAEALFTYLRATRNDLEPPAVALVPVIGRAIAALASAPGCALARMSGSGATVFGLFASRARALAAADALRRAEPGWWIAAAPVGGRL